MNIHNVKGRQAKWKVAGFIGNYTKSIIQQHKDAVKRSVVFPAWDGNALTLAFNGSKENATAALQLFIAQEWVVFIVFF